ncbi:MAG: hypothetical protein ACI4TK_13105 [Agathobacter sp.]
MSENNEAIAITNTPDEFVSMDYDNLMIVAERADKMVTALNKIMSAALKVTTVKDWVIIGGTPYLQESGATKVARMFGIGWRILDQKQEIDHDGYPTYTYRMTFTMGNISIECEGSRNARDDFFAGARTDRNGAPKKQKSPDEIDLRDVKQSAYTNCLNNGIKRILPGLRNLEIADLECAGLDVSKLNGYTFKNGSKGGRGNIEDNSGLTCEDCGKTISQKVASYSQGKYGKKLCMECQKAAETGAFTVPYQEERLPWDDDDAPPERR